MKDAKPAVPFSFLFPPAVRFSSNRLNFACLRPKFLHGEITSCVPSCRPMNHVECTACSARSPDTMNDHNNAWPNRVHHNCVFVGQLEGMVAWHPSVVAAGAECGGRSGSMSKKESCDNMVRSCVPTRWGGSRRNNWYWYMDKIDDLLVNWTTYREWCCLCV